MTPDAGEKEVVCVVDVGNGHKMTVYVDGTYTFDPPIKLSDHAKAFELLKEIIH